MGPTWDLLGTYLGHIWDLLHDTWDLLETYYMTHGTYISSFAAPIIQTGPFKARDPGNLAWDSGESHFCLF